MASQSPEDGSEARPTGRASVGRASVPSSGPAAGTPATPARGTARASARVPAGGSARSTGGSARGSAAGAASSARSGPTYGRVRDKARAKPRWGRIALVALIAVGLCGGLGLLGTWIYAKSVDGDLNRTDPFSALTGGRPPSTVSGAQNILLVGSDSRDPDATYDSGSEWRADTMIVMHIPSSQDHAYLVSLPRDLYVYVPQDAGAKECGSRRAKLNAAFAWGGMPLTIKTIECYTSVRMDHVMVIDFGGFKEVVDALGGVDMPIERTIKSIHKPFRTFTKGTMHLDGSAALDYVRQRYQLPDGDFGRVRHQQQLLKALLDKAASGQTLSSPGKLDSFLGAMTSAVTVDKDFSLIDMAVQFRGLRSQNLTFMVSPNLGGSMVGKESVVLSDREKAISLYNAMSKDTMKEWIVAHASASPKPSTS